MVDTVESKRDLESPLSVVLTMPDQINAVSSWATAHVKSRAEKKLSEYLETRQVPHFLPLLTRVNRANRSDRTFHVPLFPGYLFYDPTTIERSDVFASHKVAQVLAPDCCHTLRGELVNLALALFRDATLVQARYAEVGKPVRVVRGPMKGLRGEIVRLSGQSKLVIRVTYIGQAAELDIDERFIEPDL